jgi:hypothetical protein
MVELEMNNWVLVVGMVVLMLSMAVILVILTATASGSGTTCPTKLYQLPSGGYQLENGPSFITMNEFELWWSSHGNGCPLPVLTGERLTTRPQRSVMETTEWSDGLPYEETYAKTPIDKVDDYEFSRIFGYEKNGRMVVPPQNFNLILTERTFDWPDKPMTSDERKGKYMGMMEGFTADGHLQDHDARATVARYGEKTARNTKAQEEQGCIIDRENREVDKMVEELYKSDPDYEPVITRVGPHNWEVNELKPKRKFASDVTDPADNRVVDTSDPAVDVRFRYNAEGPAYESSIDPYYPASGWMPSKGKGTRGDPYAGPVPNMERMFGPTFDHTDWIVKPHS